jgi:hypothetical protein
MGNSTWKHRKNQDDSWDSICPHCALIIARVDKEMKLASHERMHTCDPDIFRKTVSPNFHLSFAR